MKILLIEDTLTLAMLITDLIQREGHDVFAAREICGPQLCRGGELVETVARWSQRSNLTFG
jgi:DNA-binding response OmpR family regulator